MKPFINEKHRISGTRISVYDVYHYLVSNCPHERIMAEYAITADELQAALDFIDANRDLVLKRHLEIEERNARGNPPEILAKMEISRALFAAKVQASRERNLSQEATAHDPGNRRGPQFGGPPEPPSSEVLAASGLDRLLE